MNNWDAEMERALIADGEKLRQLTGEDHGPFSIDDLAERCGDFEEPAGVRGPVRIDIDPRLSERVRSGTQALAIVPAKGPAEAPRYVHPAIAKVGDVLELYVSGERLFGDEMVLCTYVQAVSMQRNPDYSMVGRERSAFPCYLSEEKALSEMDGFAAGEDDAERFAHYCKDGKPFDGHIIHWKRVAVHA